MVLCCLPALDTRNILCVLASLIMFVTLFVLPAEYAQQMQSEKTSSHDIAHLYQVGKMDSARHVHDETTAFVFGSTERFSNLESFKCKAAVESLSKIAGFKGSIYLLSRHEQCFDQSELRETVENGNVHVINVANDYDTIIRGKIPSREKKIDSVASSNAPSRRGLRADYNHSTRGRSIPPTLSRNLAAGPSSTFSLFVNGNTDIMKTMMLDYIDDSKIETVIWYDCDSLAVRTGCAADMIKFKPQLSAQNPVFVKDLNELSTIAVSPKFSKEALLRWREAILATPKEGSKLSSSEASTVAFKDTFRDLFVNKEGSLPSSPLLHPMVADHFVNKKENVSNHCVSRFSADHCASDKGFGAHYVNGVVSKLNLDSLGGRHWLFGQHWCPGTLRHMITEHSVEVPLCSGINQWWF